jgi:hypothetical protein
VGGSKKKSSTEQKKAFGIIIRPSAFGDLSQIYEWYEDIRNGLGEDFNAAFEECMERIALNPHAFNVIYKTIRRAPFKRFPYRTIFTIDNQTINIHAIVHAARSHGKWMRRVFR